MDEKNLSLTGSDVVTIMKGKIKALYTFLDGKTSVSVEKTIVLAPDGTCDSCPPFPIC